MATTDKQKRILKKIILIGDTGVGKVILSLAVRLSNQTSFLNMSVNGKFSAQYKATIGADFLTKDIDVNGNKVTLQIWDTAGRERFQSLGVAFYRGADGVFLLYDITNKRSFESIPAWRDEFNTQSGRNDIPMVLVGLKFDLESKRAVRMQDAEQLADAWGIPFVEVSSKECLRIHEAIRMLSQAMDQKGLEEEEQYAPNLNLSLEPQGKSFGFWDFFDSLQSWFSSWFTTKEQPPVSTSVISGN